MKKYKDFIIFETKHNYFQVFQNNVLICRLNAFLNVTNVYKRISISDLKEIIKFLQNETT